MSIVLWPKCAQGCLQIEITSACLLLHSEPFQSCTQDMGKNTVLINLR
jgi:hypothetical protein